MSLPTLFSTVGQEINDVDEETFSLFSQPIPSQNLGFVDAKAQDLSIDVGNISYVIRQSPTLLHSDRDEGTTGAVLWKITPLLARWLSSSENFLFQNGILDISSTILELGCGISGLTAATLAPRIQHYILSDQAYILKHLRQNLEANLSTQTQGKFLTSKSRKKSGSSASSSKGSNISLLELDWETSSITSFAGLLEASIPVNTKPPPATTKPQNPSQQTITPHLNAILACDCIYNPSLIPPFVRTCADLCALSSDGSENAVNATVTSDRDGQPTICVIAQQLRSPDVFEEWLREMLVRFRVWRLGDEVLGEGLGEGTGMVVHVGVLRSAKEI